MSAKGMLCAGNTVIMCGTCDMGRKFFFLYDPFFCTPPPRRGGPTRKKISHPVSKNFLSPPPLVCSEMVL